MVVQGGEPLSALWLGRKTRENAVSENSIFWVGCFFFFFFVPLLIFLSHTLSFLSFPFPFSFFHHLLLFLCVLFIVRDTPQERLVCRNTDCQLHPVPPEIGFYIERALGQPRV